MDSSCCFTISLSHILISTAFVFLTTLASLQQFFSSFLATTRVHSMGDLDHVYIVHTQAGACSHKWFTWHGSGRNMTNKDLHWPNNEQGSNQHLPSVQPPCILYHKDFHYLKQLFGVRMVPRLPVGSAVGTHAELHSSCCSSPIQIFEEEFQGEILQEPC